MKFRKKPVVVEAWQCLPANGEPPQWALDASMCSNKWPGAVTVITAVRTLEGQMSVSHGDWLIRGVKGEVYPCKPDIFAATYEPVEASGREGDGDGD